VAERRTPPGAFESRARALGPQRGAETTPPGPEEALGDATVPDGAPLPPAPARRVPGRPGAARRHSPAPWDPAVESGQLRAAVEEMGGRWDLPPATPAAGGRPPADSTPPPSLHASVKGIVYAARRWAATLAAVGVVGAGGMASTTGMRESVIGWLGGATRAELAAERHAFAKYAKCVEERQVTRELALAGRRDWDAAVLTELGVRVVTGPGDLNGLREVRMLPAPAQREVQDFQRAMPAQRVQPPPVPALPPRAPCRLAPLDDAASPP